MNACQSVLGLDHRNFQAGCYWNFIVCSQKENCRKLGVTGREYYSNAICSRCPFVSTSEPSELIQRTCQSIFSMWRRLPQKMQKLLLLSMLCKPGKCRDRYDNFSCRTGNLYVHAASDMCDALKESSHRLPLGAGTFVRIDESNTFGEVTNLESGSHGHVFLRGWTLEQIQPSLQLERTLDDMEGGNILCVHFVVVLSF